MTRFLIALLAVFCAISSAEARLRAVVAHPGCNVLWPCVGVEPSARGERVVKAMHGFGTARKVYKPHAAATPQRYIRRAVLTQREAYQAPAPSLDYSIGRPARYITGRLICAVNVGAALAERGIKGTGSALALSYLRWGRSAGGPVPGAVIVSARRGGGHVAIVSRVENGVVYAWNATGGQRGWREIPYRHRVIDYRVPG